LSLDANKSVGSLTEKSGAELNGTREKELIESKIEETHMIKNESIENHIDENGTTENGGKHEPREKK